MSSIPEQIKHWEFDPTGSSPDNLVEGESHILSSRDGHNQLLSPLYGPFFTATIRDHEGNPVPESEYTYGEKIPELDGVVDRPLYHNIIFKEPRQGEYYVDYQLAGGYFTRARHELVAYLVSKLNDPIRTVWPSVTEKPHRLPAYEHRHHWIDVVNSGGIGGALDELTAGIRASFGEKSQAIYGSLITRIVNLQSTLTSYNLPDHIRDGTTPVHNVHSTDYSDIGAELTDTIAQNSDRLFGASYLVFVDYAYDVSLNWEKMADHLHIYNIHTLTGDVEVTGDIEWGPSQSSDLNVIGYFRMGGPGGVTFGPDSAMITVDSEGVKFNGERFFDRRSALDYSKTLEGELLVSIQSTDFNIEGNTTSTDPLTLTLKFPLSTNLEPGFVRLTAAVSTNSDGWGYVSFAAKEMRDTLVNYLAKTTTINGHPISEDVVVTLSDIGLGAINNTSDSAKPISTAQQAELDKLSIETHQHTWQDITWKTASDAEYGVDTITSDYYGEGTVSAKLGYDYSRAVDEVIRSFDNKALTPDFHIIGVRDVHVTSNAYTVTINSGKLLKSIEGVVSEVDLPNGYATIPNESRDRDYETLVYLMEGENGLEYIATSHPITNHETHTLVACVTPSKAQNNDLQKPIVDYGHDQGLIEHKSDKRPHGLDKPIPELSVVSNHDIFTELSMSNACVWKQDRMTFTNVNEFDRINCSGLALKSTGANPLRWRGDRDGHLVFQSSFVARGGNGNAALNLASVEHDIILGYKVGEKIEILTLKVSPNFIPRLYIETWDYITEGSDYILSAVTRAPIGLDYHSQEGYNNSDARVNMYRFFYDTGNDEFRWEIIGAKHIVQTGRVVGIPREVKNKIIELLGSSLTGVRSAANTELSVTGAVRGPHPNTPNEVNDYSTLFNTYVSAAVLDRLRDEHKELHVEETLTGYYLAEEDCIVVDSVDSVYPHGYNNFDVRLLSCKADGGVFDRDIDERWFSEFLSMGVMTNVIEWRNGFSGRVRRGEVYKIPLTEAKTYNGTVVSTPMEDGTTFKIRVRIRAFNTLWGLSSSDWNFLSKHLATRYIAPPVQPEKEVDFVLDGFISKLLL